MLVTTDSRCWLLFRLHLNSFDSLFSDAINLKLLKLTSSVTGFIGLTSDISKFIDSLKGVSGYLDNFNPAQKLLELIDTFNAKSYVDGVRDHIQKLIGEIDDKIKYDQIIEHVLSLARPYNQLLKSKFESFKEELEKHKTSLKGNIEKYTEKISRDLTKQCCCVNKLIHSICENIKSLIENQSKLSQFTEYTNKEKLMKPCTRLENGDMQKLEKIVKTHEEYKHCLNRCYPKITPELYKLMRELRFYNLWINYSISRVGNVKVPMKDNFDMNNILTIVERLKFYVDKFDKYLCFVKKLEKIGKHITTMKSNLNGIESKVEDAAARYIDGLEDITIKHSEVEKIIKSINKIKKMK